MKFYLKVNVNFAEFSVTVKIHISSPSHIRAQLSFVSLKCLR